MNTRYVYIYNTYIRIYIYIYIYISSLYTYIYIYTCYICIYPHKLYMYSGNVATERVAKTNLFCLAVERGPCQLHEFLRLFSCAFRTFHTQQNLEALSFWSHSPSKLYKFILYMFFFLLFLSVFGTVHISNISILIHHPHPHNPHQTPAFWY